MGSKKLKIRLRTQAEVSRYIHNIMGIESEVDAIKGSQIFDAKSIVAVLNINRTEDFYIEILSDDSEEINHFYNLMKEFEVEDKA